MSRTKSRRGGVKRDREQQVEDEDAPVSMQVMAHAESLMLLAVIKSNHGTLLSAQLCDPHGVALFPFVRLSPRVSHPFAGALVYSMSLTYAVRLRVVGSGINGKLVRLLSLGVGRHFEPQRNRRACHRMMNTNVRRVAAGLAAAVRNKVVKVVEELCASGQCAAAVHKLQEAMYLGDLPSRALLAWWLIHGRQGVASNKKRALVLAKEGVRLGCNHCLAVLAWLVREPSHPLRFVDAAAVEMANRSAAHGSRFGFFVLGLFKRSLSQKPNLRLFYDYIRLAAEQGLDSAQLWMGYICLDFGGSRLEQQGWYQLAAAQGHITALHEAQHLISV
jgi:TPR repeat protein